MSASHGPLIGIVCASLTRNDAPYSASPLSYSRAVAQAGGVPLLIPLLPNSEAMWGLYARLDGLLLAGGGDVDARHYACRAPELLTYIDPPRDEVELALCRRALADGLPILAICRGIQLLAVAAGGTLVEDIPSQVPHSTLRHRPDSPVPRDAVAHAVRVSPQSLLADALQLDGEDGDDVGVNSFHHQAVRDPGEGLAVSAVASDGVVEALERAPERGYLLGVQWHPEEMIDADAGVGIVARSLFRHYVEACRR
jgi:putative glutamine amidotransferase